MKVASESIPFISIWNFGENSACESVAHIKISAVSKIIAVILFLFLGYTNILPAQKIPQFQGLKSVVPLRYVSGTTITYF